MKKSFLVIGLSVVFVFLVGALVVASRKQGELRQVAEAAKKHELEEAARQKQKIEELKSKFEASEADVVSLLGAVRSTGPFREGSSSRPPTTLRELSAELKRAEQLSKGGNHAGALDIYINLYKNGWIGTSTLSRNLVVDGMAKLGELYAPALQALRQARDDSLAHIAAGTGDQRLAVDVVILNKALGDDASTIALYNQLPANDPRRQDVAAVGEAVFVKNGSYSAVVAARPFGTMLNEFEGVVRRQGNTDQMGREYVIHDTVKNIEALVGAGLAWEGQVLIGRLLNYDNSEATRALIDAHVNKAKAAPKS